MRYGSRFLSLALIAFGVLSFGSTAGAATLVLDGFTTALVPTQPLTSTGLLVSSNPQSGGSIAASASRVATVLEAGVGGSATLAISPPGAPVGVADLSTSTSADGTFTLTYTFAPSQNLTGANGIQLNIAGLNKGGVGNNLNPTGQAFVNNVATSVPLSISANGAFALPFVGGPGVNSIALQFFLPQGADFQITQGGINIPFDTPVPEPASIATFAVLGVAGLIAARRRKVKAEVAA